MAVNGSKGIHHASPRCDGVPVITVGKSATVRDVAKILLEKRISAVPVVDDAGKVVGIVTEGDLIYRAEAGTERPYSWWVHFLAGDATIAADYAKSHAQTS